MMSQQPLIQLQSYQKSVHTMQLTFSFFKDQKYMVTASADGDVYCWDLEKVQKAFTFKSKITGLVYKMKPFNNSSKVVAATDSIKVFDFETKKALFSIQDAHYDSIKDISVSSDDRYIATGCVENFVKIWDCATAKLLHSVNLPFQAKLTGLHFLGNKREMIVSTSDFVGYWDIKKKKMTQKIHFEYEILSTQVLKHQNEIIVVFYENGITLISGISRKKVLELEIHGIRYLVGMALTEKLPHTIFAVDNTSNLLEINILKKAVMKKIKLDDVRPIDVMISTDCTKLIAADDKGGFKAFNLNLSQ